LTRQHVEGTLPLSVLTKEYIEIMMREVVLNRTVPAPYRNVNSTLGELAALFASPTEASWGAYLFLEKELFVKYPELWAEDVGPLPPVLDPVDFSTPGMGHRRSLLMGRKGSRSFLHQDPFAYTSWIAAVSGRKAFKLWQPNLTENFYPEPGPGHSGVRKTLLDAFGEVPIEAVDYHAVQPLEVVLEPGEILVTQDWWHQALNMDDSIAVTGNYIDKSNIRGVLHRANASGMFNSFDAVVLQVQQRDPALFEILQAEGWLAGLLVRGKQTRL